VLDIIDPSETPIYSASHLYPRCLHTGQLVGLGLIASTPQ